MTPRLPTPSTARAHRRLPTAISFLLVGSVAVAGCGNDDAGAEGSVDGITVEGEYGEEPTVEVERPYDVTEAESVVLVDGEGEEIEAGDEISVDFFVTDGTTGEQEQSSYETEPVTLQLEEGTANPALLDALVGASVNDRILVVLPPEEPPPGAAAAPTGTDTVIFVIDVLDVLDPPLNQAEGEALTPPEGLPAVETDDSGVVTGITVPADTPAPTELVSEVLIEGEGPPVEADDTLVVHYTGVLYDGGEVFDSSWERGEPASFPLSGVIQGWQQGLEGVPVGSRVLLVVPPELGYGAEGSPPTIPADATLVFVVDILAAR